MSKLIPVSIGIAEYVIPLKEVTTLGNGNLEEGVKQLQKLSHEINCKIFIDINIDKVSGYNKVYCPKCNNVDDLQIIEIAGLKPILCMECHTLFGNKENESSSR